MHKKGTRHHSLKANAKYSAMHSWLRRNFVKEKCEGPDGIKHSKHLEWALKEGKRHAHERSHYLCLCASCHRIYDYLIRLKKKK